MLTRHAHLKDILAVLFLIFERLEQAYLHRTCIYLHIYMYVNNNIYVTIHLISLLSLFFPHFFL